MKTRTVRWLHYLAICMGILFILWSLFQYQSYALSKDIGVEGVGQITTDEVSPGSIMFVHASSTRKMDTRVVRNDNRDMVFVGNNSYYDRHLSAGGPPGDGVGTDVNLWVQPALGPTTYTIQIKAPSDTSIDYTEADVKYDISVTVWTPSYPLLIAGFVIIFSALTMGTVLGIGLFGPGAYRPRPREGAMPEAMERDVPPVRAPAPVQARQLEMPEPLSAPAPAARRAGPPPRAPPPESEFEPRYEVQGEVAPPPAPAPRRGEPVWDMAPARVDRHAAAAPEPGKPLKKIKCSACGAIIPVYSAERPLRVTCPLCGRQGTLQR
jgi:hypothetical protein